MEYKLKTIVRHFSLRDIGIAGLLALLAVLFGYFGLPFIVPSLGGAGFVHGMLKLPGPGAGIVISSAVVCFWLVLGRLLVKKSWTAILMALFIILIRILWGIIFGLTPTDGHNQVAAIAQGALMSTGIGRLDVVLVAAIIIELAFMLPVAKKPWRYVFPAVVGIMGMSSLLLLVTGQVTSGENGAGTTGFPIGYAIVGVLALCVALICYVYPVSGIVGSGLATAYWICHYWLFWGKNGFASAFPATGSAIIVLLTYCLEFGALTGAIAYGVDLLRNTYSRHDVKGG